MQEEAQHGGTALSRPLSAAEVPPEGLDLSIVATEAERDALARLNSLPAVLSFEARLRARRWRGDGLEIEGELSAEIRQTCVLTLEAFDSTIVQPIDIRFAPAKEAPPARSRRAAPEPEPEEDISGEDPPDPLIGGVADLGAVASEFFTLALDPYPRRPGAEFVEPAPAAGGEAISPFAKLKARGGEPPAND